jgi:hypothetical protein
MMRKSRLVLLSAVMNSDRHLSEHETTGRTVASSLWL